MTTQVILDTVFEAHDPGPMHPESPGRVRAIGELLARRPVQGAVLGAPRGASDEELQRVHPLDYLDVLRGFAGRRAQLDPDTAVGPQSVSTAWLAAGAAAQLAENTWRRTVSNGFAVVRPPGHHAERARAMGFCLLNNVAVATAAVLAAGAQRVLVLDWDVHHGNGTQSIFYARSDVLYVSLHQWPLYPGTGALTECGTGVGKGFTVNLPLPPGADDADYGLLFDEVIVPLAAAYRPEVVLVSAGFDAHRDDPLGQMRVTERGFAAMCTAAHDIATESSGGRLALFLEGGYELNALADSAHACVEVLAGARREAFPAGASAAASALAAGAKAVLRDALPRPLLDQPSWRRATGLLHP